MILKGGSQLMKFQGQSKLPKFWTGRLQFPEITYIILQSWQQTKVNKKILIWYFIKEFENNAVILMQNYSCGKYMKFLEVILKTLFLFLLII